MSADQRQLPAEPGTREGITVRCWRPGDAAALNAVVAASRPHLAPWMTWADDPPDTLERRIQRIDGWERDRQGGGDATYGFFAGDQIVGGGGLHRRLGPSGLEIGYWLAEQFTGRGVMTVAAALMTDAAFSVPAIDVVEIHHDKANERSAGVPRRLGYELVGEIPDPPRRHARAEIGIDCCWRMTRARWLAAPSD